MMLTEIRKKSGMVANTGFDLDKLLVKEPCFIPCTYEEGIEEITFCYEAEGLHPLTQIKNEERKYQYQFLINFYRLNELRKGYSLMLAMDNIYYDDNYLPYIKNRDLYSESGCMTEDEFLLQYKMFVGGILSKKYSIEELQESGLEALKQEAAFIDFYEADSLEMLQQVLKDRKAAVIKKENDTTVRVNKKGYMTKSILAVTATGLLTVAIGVLCYGFFYLIPQQKSVIKANQAYIQLDYVNCIDSMERISPEVMDAPTKYILAVSYAKCESLKKEEMENIVSKLSLMSNQKELEYWIYLGRMEYATAEELAQALSDDQLLVYAYMKELDRLESDTSMNGEEKQERISTLQDKIIQLGEKYTPEEEK